MNNIPTINEIDNNSPSQDSKDVVVSATVNQPQVSEVEEKASARATIEEIDATRKPTISEIYQIVNDGLFEATTNWWDYSYKLSQAQINQDIISRLDNGEVGGGYNKPGVEIITTTSDKTPTNTNVYSALKSDSLYPKKLVDENISGVYDFLNGITIGKFSSTTGARIYPDTYGRSHLDVDYLNVRLKAIFETLQILNVETIGGKMIISPAGSIRIAYVNTITETIDNVEQEVYRCYFLGEQDGNEVDNKWKVGDQAQAKSFNVKKGIYHRTGNHYLWRLVVGVSEEPVEINGNKYHYVDLSDVDCAAASDVPQPGDVLNQLGYRGDDVQRQAALVFSAVDGNAPSITLYSGINSYDMTNKEYVEYGVVAGKAYFNLYGETYIGARDQSTYINYSNGKLSIKADISAASVGDKSLKQYVEDNTKVDKKVIEDIVNNADVIKSLQNQVDGAIETWFYDGVPTLSNLPASDWTTKELKEKHRGDLYYDRESGYAYRFTEYDDDNNPYAWSLIQDTDITKALNAAENAQKTANSKMTVYSKQPKSYKAGDIWVNATYADDDIKFNNDILVALKDNTSFDINDWQLASRYDEAFAQFDAFSKQYQKDIEIINKQFDHVAQTWYQATDPSKTDGWTPSEHDGDLWYDTTTNKTFIYTNGKWVQKFVPDEVFDSIDGKSTIFIDDGNEINDDSPINNGYEVGDIWILPSDYTIGKTKYYKGDILTTKTKSSKFDSSHWTKLVRYTDDTKVSNVVANLKKFISTTDELGNEFENAAADGIFNAAEKASILKSVDNVKDVQYRINATIDGLLKSEYLKSDGELNAEGKKLSDAKKDFNDNINDYLEYVTKNVESGTYTGLDSAYYTNKRGYVTTAINTVQNAISAAELYINQQTKESIIGTITSQYNYLAEAIKNGKTNITGGLVTTGAIILSNVIDEKNSTEDEKVYEVTAGINGQKTANGVTNDRAIAAWFGGPMEDKDIIVKSKADAKPGIDYARSLFRHDGTGYLAGGKIYWDKNGVLTVSPDSLIANLSGEEYNLVYFAYLFQLHWKKDNPSSIADLSYIEPKFPFDHLDVLNTISVPKGSIEIGDIVLSYDENNKALKITHKTSGTKANVYASGGISAYGVATTTSGGGGLNGKVLPYNTAINLTSSTDETTNIASAWSIKKLYDRIESVASAIPSIKVSVAAGGNALTGATYSNGIISFTKATFLTSSDLNGYATQAWVEGKGYLTSHQSLANYLTKDDASDTYLTKTAAANDYQVKGSYAAASHTHNYLSTLKVGTTSYNVDSNTITIPAYPESLPANDVYDWAKKSTKPSYSWEEINERPSKVSDFENDSEFITASASITGNAATATKLQTTRSINGTSFNGTADITTARWGTSRSLWGNSVNGGSDVSGSITIANTDGAYVQIGGVRLVYDKANAAIKVVQSDGKTSANFYATGGITAYGDSSVSGGGSGFNGSVLNLTSIRNKTFNDTDYTTIPNAAALKTVDSNVSNLSNSLTSLSTKVTNLEGGSATSVSVTGSGNAVTAVSKSGTTITFTKGSTFLTSHQSLSNYLTKTDANDTYLKKAGDTATGAIVINKLGVGTNAPLIVGSTNGNINTSINVPYNDVIRNIIQITSDGTKNTALALGFHNPNWFSAYFGFYKNANNNSTFFLSSDQTFGFDVGGSITATSYVKKNGTSSQFLKADGSVDSNTYLTSHQNISGKLNIDGSNSMTGNLYLASIGTSYIGKGAKDTSGSDYSDANIVIRSWWGITFKSYDNVNRAYLDTRTGSFGCKGTITANKFSGYIERSSGGSTISGRDHAVAVQTYAPGGSSWNPVACVYTETGTWTLGHLSSGNSNTDFNFCFSTNADYNAGKNDGTYITLRNKAGTLALTSDIPTSLPANGGNADTVDNVHVIWSGSLSSANWLTAWENDGSKLRAILPSNINAGSATKLANSRTIWGQSFNGTANITGMLTLSDGSHTGLKLGSTYLSCLSGNVIFQNNTAIRFGGDSWDWNVWAGLKYNHSNKTIYLGLADGSVFTANSAQTGGELRLPNINQVTSFGEFFVYKGQGATPGGTYEYGTTYSYSRITCSFGVMAPSNTINLYDSSNGISISAYGTLTLSASTGHAIYLNSANNVVIRCSNTYAALDINGAILASGNITASGNILAKGGVSAYQTSDIRLKTNLHTLDYIQTIKSLGSVYEFNYKKDNKSSIGLIAQNVQNSILADLVETDEEGYLKLNYWSPKLISLALGGITQVDDEVTRLKARVRELENEVKQLKNKDYELQ